MDAKLKRKHRNDWILAAAMLLLATAGFLMYQAIREEGSYAVVTQSGEETGRFSLKEDQEFRIELPSGEYNVLCIEAGKVYMKDADCPDQICVQHRAIANVGETIVCLPHKVVIQVVSGEPSQEIDIVV